MRIEVLDGGYVEFIEAWGHGKAGWDIEGGCEDNEVGIIEAARQSTQGSFRGWEDRECGACHGTGAVSHMNHNPCSECGGKGKLPGDRKLLSFLYDNKHATPFEFAGMVIEVQAPIMVFREWHRHRTQCLAAGTPLVFNNASGRACRMPIGELVRKWNPPAPKRARYERTRQDCIRGRISNMRLRGTSGDVSVQDAWYSGEKPVYRLRTKYGEVTASADHLFKTPEGGVKLGDNPKQVMAMIQSGEPVLRHWPEYTAHEIATETWRPWQEDYEVSNLGRVRSYLTTRGRRTEPVMKALTPNRAGRLMTSTTFGCEQVSLMVWEAFVGPIKGQILHKNDNSWDNRLSNLYEGTAADNARDRIINGGQTRLREVPVDVISVDRAGVSDTFDISVTGNHWFVADNLVVHNSYNEMSARYAPMPDVHYLPSVDRCLYVDPKNKQAGKIKGSETLDSMSADLWLTALAELYDHSERVYADGLRRGVPKEIARLAVTVARYSRMRASANLRNWLAFITLRSDPKAQQEIRAYSDALGRIVESQFPQTWDLFQKDRK